MRILIVRVSAIGDIVFASPLIAALRRAYPEAHIAWLVRPDCAPLLRHHPDLNEVILWPYQTWQTLWRERRWGELARAVQAFRRDLASRGFDLALDLQGLLKSGVLTRMSGARERIGLGSREGSQWLMTRTLPRGGDAERIGSEYLYLAEHLGLPVNGFEMAVHYGPAEAERAGELIHAHGLERVREPYAKHLEGPLWEMRMKGKDGIARALYVTAEARRIVIVRVFRKKTPKTPRRRGRRTP